MPKCDFNKVAKQFQITLRHGCSPVTLLHIFSTPFPENISGRLVLDIVVNYIFVIFSALPISRQCAISIPPGNVRKPEAF